MNFVLPFDMMDALNKSSRVIKKLHIQRKNEINFLIIH